MSGTLLNNLPRQLTPFIGREKELAEIGRLLGDPTCWLLTLVGPGGIGKTRLAIQAAATMLSGLDQDLTNGRAFADGVFLVDLQPVLSADLVPSTVADALHFPLSGQQESHIQLFNYLADKQLLLVLDSFEHLLDGAGLLADLLQAAPGVKLLVTSQEVLNLEGEWLYPVGGLPFPSGGDRGDMLASCDAVQLFAERAQRVRPGFSLAAEEEGVVRIGMSQAYPNAYVDGYDLDEPSIELARANAREAGLNGQLAFHVRDAGDPTLAGSYDLVTAFECVHDMSDPVSALRTVRRLVKGTGAVIVADERVGDSFTANGNDVEWMMYGWSVLHCLPVGMADQPSVGTGTVMRADTLRRFAQEAGFREVEVLPIENYFFRFYRLYA